MAEPFLLHGNWPHSMNGGPSCLRLLLGSDVPNKRFTNCRWDIAGTRPWIACSHISGHCREWRKENLKGDLAAFDVNWQDCVWTYPCPDLLPPSELGRCCFEFSNEMLIVLLPFRLHPAKKLGGITEFLTAYCHVFWGIWFWQCKAVSRINLLEKSFRAM